MQVTRTLKFGSVGKSTVRRTVNEFVFGQAHRTVLATVTQASAEFTWHYAHAGDRRRFTWTNNVQNIYQQIWHWQVCVQLPTSADNVALPAYGRYTPLLQCGCCWAPAMQQSIDISCPPGPQQQTHKSGMRRANGTDGPATVTYTLLCILCKKCQQCTEHIPVYLTMLDRNWWIFFTYIKDSIRYNSVYLILACLKNFV